MKTRVEVFLVVFSFLVATIYAASVPEPSISYQVPQRVTQQIDNLESRVKDLDSRLSSMIDTWNDFQYKNDPSRNTRDYYDNYNNNYYNTNNNNPYYGYGHGKRYHFK